MINRIGKVVKVSYDRLVFEVTDFTLLDFNFNGTTYTTNGVIDYVTIVDKRNQRFVYQITEVEDRELPLNNEEDGKFDYIGRFACSPIGIIRNKKIEFNLETYPFLQDEVFLTTDEEYKIIFDTDEAGLFIGKIRSKFNAVIDPSKLFTHHSAILGNTGSGKSTTIRQILNQVKKMKTSNLYVHVFDVHREYEFKDDKTKIIDVLEEYKIPIQKLELQDWINLVRPSDLVQLPILQSALKIGNILKSRSIDEIWLRCYIAYTMYKNVQTDAVAKRIKIIKVLEGTEIKTSKYDGKFANFDNRDEEEFLKAIENTMENIHGAVDGGVFLQDKMKAAKSSVDSFESLYKGLEFTFLLEECKGNNMVRGHSGTMETRIKSLESRYGGLLSEKSDNAKFDEKVVNVYSVYRMDDEQLLFFTSFFIKNKFEENRNKKEKDLHVFILEEAHRYISKNLDKSSFNEADLFKKIAREGRKFGCFLFLSSQRPSELLQTVLSQCNNYLIHRIKNTIDLEQMLSSIPYIGKSQLGRITFLPTGTVYAVGEVFPIPIEVSVANELNQDVSSTPKIKYKYN